MLWSYHMGKENIIEWKQLIIIIEMKGWIQWMNLEAQELPNLLKQSKLAAEAPHTLINFFPFPKISP